MDETFSPGDLGYLIGEMVGGPLDGRKYGDIPVLPQGPPTAIRIPLDSPGNVYADNALRPVPPVEGVWKYDFTPTGESDDAGQAARRAVAPAHP